MTNEAFAQRIIDMMPTLYRVSYALLAEAADREDAVQECLQKAWQKRGALREEKYLQTWVTRILINECHNTRRRRFRGVSLEAAGERAAPADADAELHDMLMGLEERLRMPVVLHYIEGYSIEEIAKILRLPQGTVKTRMARARKELRVQLTGEEARV